MPISTRSSTRAAKSSTHITQSSSGVTLAAHGHVAKKNKKSVKKSRIVIARTLDDFLIDSPIGEIVNIYTTEIDKV